MKTTNTIFTRLFLLIITLVMTGTGQLWADSWTWTVADGDQYLFGADATLTAGAKYGIATLNGKKWSFSRGGLYMQKTATSSTNVLQFGKSSNPENVVLSTRAFNGTITQIDVNCASAGGKHTCKIEVGGTTVKSATSTSSWTTVSTISTGTISQQGEIKITFDKGTNTGAVYINSITVTYTSTTYNVDWYVGSSKEKGETSVTHGTPPSVADNALGGSCSSLKFLGWSETNIGSTPDDVPDDLFQPDNIPGLTKNTTYYAVFGDLDYDTNDSTLIQLHRYDTWTYSLPTKDGSSYRLFGNGAYVSSAALRLEGLACVYVSGGTVGGSSYNGIFVKDEDDNNWKTGTVSSTTKTATYKLYNGASLSGKKSIHVGSSSGNGSSTGVGLTSVRIFSYIPEYSNCVTTCGSCTEEPLVRDAAFKGIAAGTISVSCDAIVNDDGCTTEEYGFVWKTGASAPASTSDGTKVKVGEGSGGDAGFSTDLSISFTTGTTYQIVSYATNAAGTTLGTAVAVVPQSVTFNSNGGSEVATQYVKSGGTVSAPDDPTKSGFVFGGWYQESGLTNEVDWSATISADKTYYAKWLTYGDYKFSCAELTLTAHPETAGAPIFITSTAEKKVRSQGYIQITGSGLTPSTALSFPGLNSKFEIKTASGGAISTDENGEIDDVDAYIFYTPGVGDTDDGLDELTGITVSVGGPKPKQVSLTQSIIGRHLPTDFVIAGKKDGKWYALPSNMESTSHPAPSEIAVDNTTNPAIAYTDASNKYGLEGPTTGASGNIKSGVGQYVKLTMHPLSDAPLFGQAPSNTGIGKSGTAVATNDLSAGYWWQLKQTNTSITNPQDAKYTIYCANNTSSLSIKDNAGNPEWGLYASGIEELRLIPASSIVFAEAEIVEWGQHGAIIEVDATAISATKVKAILNETESAIIAVSQTGTSVKGSATKYNYTAAFVDGIDFAATTSNGAMLTLEWYNSSSVLVAVSNINVPKIIAASATMSSLMATDDPWNSADVHVLPGVTLTANAGDFSSKDVVIDRLEIYPGATVNVTKGSQDVGTLKVRTLVLRNGWTRVSSKSYDVARLYVPTDANLAKNAVDNVWYSDWYIDYDQYYPIAVPFPVATSGITYKNTKSTATAGVRLRYYSGKLRAANVQENQDDNWVEYTWGGTMPTNLKPSHGYIMTAKRPTGKAFSIVRMPMTFTNEWAALGEKGEVSETHKDTVYVKAWGDANTPSYAKGWNIIANPYMALHRGALSYNDASGDAIEYANIPDISFKEYDQLPILTTKLKPASAFLVQAPKTGTVTFGATARVVSAPSYKTESTPVSSKQKAYIELSNEEANDMMGLIISDQYTAEYEINADLEKLLGDGTSLKTYMHYSDRDMAYLAINKVLAQEWIPVSVRLPQTGEYTFSLHEASIAGELEGVYLIDYTSNEVTNLIENSYTFVAEAGTINNRFAINATVGERQTPTAIDVVGVDKTGDGPIKFLYRDKVYIWHKGNIYDATGKKVKGGLK